MPEGASTGILLTLVAFLPFEPVYDVLGLSVLQWLFVALAIVSVPELWKQRRMLFERKVVIAGAAFLMVCVASALLADELDNSLKVVARFGAGLVLLSIALTSSARKKVVAVWSVSAVVAATYGLVDSLGFGFPELFRTGEYFLGTVTRLSGSFEYPTTAAAYFAMSIPLIWSVRLPRAWRILGSLLVWSALILTFSRGAIGALFIVLATRWVIERVRSRREPTYKKGVQYDSPFLLGILGVSAYLLVSLFQPLLIDRFRAIEGERAVGAVYEPRFNVLTLHPDSRYELPVRITNTGRERWRSSGRRRITLSHYWYDVRMKEIVELESQESLLPYDIEAGETVEVTARIRTPASRGLHLLDLDLRQRGYGEFSIAGVYPGVVEVELDATIPERFSEGDVSRWYRRGPKFRPTLDASVSRPQLWSAALQLPGTIHFSVPGRTAFV